MDEFIKKWWLTMSEGRLRHHLTVNLKYPPETVATLVNRVMELKESERQAKIRKTVSGNLWDEFLAAPRYELQIVRVLKSNMKRMGSEGNAKWQALCAYEDSIAATIDRIKRTAVALGASPGNLAAKMHAEGHTLPRGYGQHWTDYVKKSEIERVTELFASLPPPSRGRTKSPYTRTVPPDIFKNKKVAIIKRLNEEIEGAERERAVAEDPEDIKRLDAALDKMYEAQFKIDQHPKRAPLPATWHGFVK